MKTIGESSLWVEKYRPRTFEDIIAPKAVHSFLQSVKEDQETPNVIFDGPAGTGKTTIARAIAKEIGVDPLFVPASLDTSIDKIRFEVQGYATTQSLYSDLKKIVILDEFDRLSLQAMDSLKSLIEMTESNCRYIFTTNNAHKIEEPILSRCQQFSFGGTEDRKEMMIQYFKRASFILTNENIPFDKVVIRDFVVKMYPDFRKIVNTLHKYSKMHSEINEGIMKTLDESQIKDLVSEMKVKNFFNIQSIARNIDPNDFYSNFYGEIKEHLKPESIPDIIVTLAEYNFRHGFSNDPEINLIACLVELVRECKWK